MIIVSHTYNGYPIDNPSFYFPEILNYLQMGYWGGMGVGIFLFLSGYGLLLSLDKRIGIDWRYVSSKIKRLFEPFLIYWVVEIIVLAIFNQCELTLHLLEEFVTFSIHPDTENWFFKVIVIVYMITIGLFKCSLKNSIRIAILFILSFTYLLVMRGTGLGQWWYNTILCFPVGALVAYRYNFFSSLNPVIVSLTSFGLLLGLFFVHMNTIVLHLCFVILCSYIIPLFKQLKFSGGFWNKQNRLLYYIGYNSFIFYFIECPIMDEVMMFCYNIYPLYCVLSVIGTFILSFVCVECSNFISYKVWGNKSSYFQHTQGR